MATSGAMVQLKVVKGGGAGTTVKMDCDAIFACFDPPIEMGPHDEAAKSIARQAEHVPPCSNMHVKGRGGQAIPGCEKYSTSKAMTWIVEDGQRGGTEHQRLTKAMRDFSRANGKTNKTLKQWMDKYEKAAKDVLKDRKVSNKGKNLDKTELAAAAAKCIRDKVDDSFKGKVDQNTPLRNGQAGGKPPKAPSITTARGGGSF
jgi:hypothetical protein